MCTVCTSGFVGGGMGGRVLEVYRGGSRISGGGGGV